MWEYDFSDPNVRSAFDETLSENGISETIFNLDHDFSDPNINAAYNEVLEEQITALEAQRSAPVSDNPYDRVPAEAPPEEAPSGFLHDITGGAVTAAVGGVKQAYGSLQAATGVALGDESLIQDALDDASEIEKSDAQERFMASLAEKRGEDDSGWTTAVNILSTVVQQPVGAAHEILAQIPNSSPMIAGMWAGSKVGALLTAPIPLPGARVIGAMIGGITGMLVGNTAVEGGYIAQGEMSEGTYDRADVATKALKKGGFITALDTVSMGVSKALFSPGVRIAQKAGRGAVRDVLVKEGMGELEDAALTAALKANPAVFQRAKQAGEAAVAAALPKGMYKAALGATAMTSEMATETFGEYGGSKFAGIDASFEDALLEGFMALGHGAGEVAIGASLAGSRKLVSSKLDNVGDIPNATASQGAASLQERTAEALEDEIAAYKQDVADKNSEVTEQDFLDLADEIKEEDPEKATALKKAFSTEEVPGEDLNSMAAEAKDVTPKAAETPAQEPVKIETTGQKVAATETVVQEAEEKAKIQQKIQVVQNKLDVLGKKTSPAAEDTQVINSLKKEIAGHTAKMTAITKGSGSKPGPQPIGVNTNRPAAPANEPVNPIDLGATPEEKAQQLKKLSDENEPIVAEIMSQISEELGIETGSSYKKEEMIISKASRPSIIAEKPWHDVEHVRDSFRFKAITNTLEDYIRIAEILVAKGVKIIKLDTKKMLAPKEWGWRFAAFDLQMANGQLVEFYAPLQELETAKKEGNHELFDKWRDATPEERKSNKNEYQRDLLDSFDSYQAAWESALGRLGLDSNAADASWTNVAASLESVIREKESLSSSGEKVPINQAPSNLTKGSDKRSDKTITDDLSSVAETTSLIKAPPTVNSNTNITTKRENVKEGDQKDALRKTEKRDTDTAESRNARRQRIHETTESKDSRETEPKTKGQKAFQGILKLFKLKPIFWTPGKGDAQRINGFVDPAAPSEVYINSKARMPLPFVVGHETLHQLKINNRKLYDFLTKNITIVEGGIEAYKTKLNKGLKPSQQYKTNKSVLEELLGDFAGEQFMDPVFWQKLNKINSTFTGQIIQVVSGILAKIKNFTHQGTPYIANYNKAQNALVAAMSEFQKAGASQVEVKTQETKYSRSPKREKTTGRYVGAPDWVGNSPQKLGALKRKLKQLTLEGTAGRYWYENSSKAILKITGGNKKEAERIVSLIAIYSPNAAVPANTTMALTAYYQWRNRQSIKASFGASNRKAEDLLLRGVMWDGIKTNSFYQNLMVEIDPSKLDPGVATMDMWMAIAFDYGSKKLDQGPKYKFAEGRINEIATDMGWKPHQVQAAIWTAMKSRYEPLRATVKAKELKLGIGEMYELKGKQRYRVKKDRSYDHYRLIHKMSMSIDQTADDIEAAKYDFSNAFEERTAQLSWEATPSTDVEDVAFIHKADTATKFKYLEGIQGVMYNKNGNDVVAQMVGLADVPHMFGYSAWEGDIGAGAQDFIPVPSQGEGKNRTVKKDAAEILTLYATIRGLVLRQDMVVWHVPIYQDIKKRHNGFELRTQRPVSEQEMITLYNAINKEFNTWELAPGYIENGVRILNFTDEYGNIEFQSKMNKVMVALPNAFGGGGLVSAGYRSDGKAVTNNWMEDKNGESYTDRINTRRPDLQGRISDLRSNIEAFNKKFTKKYGPKKATVKFSKTERTAGPGSKRAVKLTHWTRAEGLQKLDPARHGSGYIGAESKRKASDPDHWIDRTYYGLKGYTREPGLGSIQYTTSIPANSLYDFEADPQKLLPQAREIASRANGWSPNIINIYEQQIKAAGYKGYKAKNVAAVFEALNVQSKEAPAPQRFAKNSKIKYSKDVTSKKFSKASKVDEYKKLKANYENQEVFVNDLYNKQVSKRKNIGRPIATKMGGVFRKKVEVPESIASYIGDYGSRISVDDQDLYFQGGGENGTIYLSNIAVDGKGTKLGTRFMAALKEFADETGQNIAVYKVTNPKFFKKIQWLEEESGGDFKYTTQEDNFVGVGELIDIWNSNEAAPKFSKALESTAKKPTKAKGPTNILTKAFRKWFGKSVVTVDGKVGSEPLVVYHGTATVFKDGIFNIKRHGRNDRGWYGKGFSFSESADLADMYASTGGKNANIMPVYLSMQNPYIIGSDSKLEDEWGDQGSASKMTDFLKAKGFDGALVYEEDGWIIEALVFDPTQIKSVYNKGTWDGTNPDIRYSKTMGVDPVTDTYFGLQTSKLDKLVEAVTVDPIKKFNAWARTNLADRLDPVRKIGKEAYVLHRMLGNIASQMAAFLQSGKFEWDGNGLKVTKGEAFLPWFKSLKKDGPKFLQWVAAKRAEALEADIDPETGKGRENFLTKEKRDNIFAATWPSNSTYAAGLNTKFKEFNDNILDIAEQAGVINAKARAEWDQEFYIPFYRLMDEASDTGELLGSPSKIRRHVQSGIKRLKGSENAVGDLMENILTNWTYLVNESMRNQARSHAFEAGKRMGMMRRVPKKFLKMSDKTTLSFLRNGQSVYFQTLDEEVFNALSEFNHEHLDGLLSKMFGKAKSVLTWGVTLSPAFRVANALRDTVATGINSPHFIPFVDSLRGMVKIITKHPDYIAYTGSGGAFTQGYVRGHDPKAQAKYIGKLSKKKLITFKTVYDAWQYIGDVSEMMARVQLYSNLKKVGKSHLEASYEAKDVMDFTMKGASKTMNTATNMIPFMNARIQGLYRMGRGFKDNPISFMTKGALLTISTMALWAIWKDDDRYKELPDEEKWLYHHLWNGEQHIRIPKAFEVGMLFSSVFEEMGNIQNGTEEGKHVWDFLGHAFQETLAMNPVPQLVKPMAEVFFNKNFFTGNAIEGMGDSNRSPGLRAGPWTSVALRDLGEKLNISPKKVEHVLRGYLGAVGTGLVMSADLAYTHVAELPDRPDMSINQYPLVGRFLREKVAQRTKYGTRAWEIFREVAMINSDLNYMKKNQRFGEMTDILKNKKHKLIAYEVGKGYKRQLDSLRTTAHNIQISKTMLGSEKKQKLSKIMNRRNNIQKKMYEAMHAIIKKGE